MSRQYRIARILLLLIATSAAVSGCGDDGLGTRYKVSGTITYKGAPLEKGMINFIAESPDGRSATGTISKGSYTLQTQEPGDGAFPGKYFVTVTSKTPDLTAAAEAAKAKGTTSAYTPSEFLLEAAKKAPNEVPAKYGSVNGANNLRAEVKAQSNTINFELVD